MTIADAWRELDDELAGQAPDPGPDGEVPPIRDQDEANRALRRLRRIRLDFAAVKDAADAELTRIQEYVTDRAARADAAAQFELERLGRYHRAILATNPRAKTIELPNGKLIARAQQPEWVFDETFLAWALEFLPAAVRQKPTPAPEIDKAAAKDALTRRDEKGRTIAVGITADGEEPPGLVVAPREDKFDVEVS